MTDIYYIRIAMEKDAGLASIGSSMLRHGSKIIGGIRSFAHKPISTTMKRLFWTRAKPGEYMKGIKGELGFGAKWGGGLGATGIVATPLFTQRDI
jgi:hypothetical protein